MGLSAFNRARERKQRDREARLKSTEDTKPAPKAKPKAAPKAEPPAKEQ